MGDLTEFYRDYSESQILNANLIEEILSIESVQIRERQLLGLETRAKDLKISNNFKRLYKSVQAEMVQRQKQINSLETQFTKVPDNLKLKCKSYVCNDLGVTKPEFDPVLMRTKDILVCTHPILPVERLINIDTNVEKVKLAFYKDKKWQTVIAERNTLASKNKILQLANTGIEVNENNAKELITYISELIAINSETIPYNQSTTHLGWVENGFVPYIKNYKFDGDRSFEGIFKDINSKGDYELWKEKMYELRAKNETLHFIIASSFASALIEKVHINPFIVHLWGKSGTGKTVALMIAMSVWGNPKIGHLVKNLNSTSVGLERLSAFLNNIPFAGDELQAIKSKYSDFNELIYSLTQGEGKSRGTADGGIQEQLKWNCAFLTTGEEPITSETSKEGVKNRVIEIEENEKIIADGKEIVNLLLENYGHAGMEFIETLPDIETLNKRHTEIFNELNSKVENSTGKQLNAIALVVLADEIASRNIFHDTPLSLEQAQKYFSKDIDEAERIYNLIIDWFYQNINRFGDTSTGDFFGTYETNQDGSVNSIYFIPTVLKKFLADNNVNFDGIKSKLLNAGHIECEKGRYTTNKWINNKSVRTIKFIINNNEDFQLEMEMPF